MPIPSPHKGEDRDSFIDRCMGDSAMVKDYPKSDQRAAVCFDAWRGSRGKGMLSDLTPGGIEYRTALELRADGRTLFGLAAPYGQPARIEGFTETIARGAFAATIRDSSGANTKADVMLLRDHDLRQLLARTSNRSLMLEDASDGLRFRTAELPSFTAADDALAMARAGLLAGCSIGFRVRGEAWNATRDQRTLTDIELIEVSAVQSAVAYEGTSIAARAKVLSRDDRRARLRLRLAGL